MGQQEQRASADFDSYLQRWRDWATSPWGRIRFAVVERTLTWQLTELVGDRPARVLDVGGGDGRDALPLAQQGHRLTILDPSPGMLHDAQMRAEELGVGDRVRVVEGSLDEDLAEWTAGDYDLVLCHFVLQYRAPGSADLRRMAGALRPGGRLSVIAPNPVGTVLSRLVRGGPDSALTELERPMSESVTFRHEVRKISYDEMRDDLVEAGLEVVAQYGGRCANDLLTDDAAKHDPDYFTRLLELELSMCDREPYKRMGLLWQLVAQKA